MRSDIFRPVFDKKERFIDDGKPCYLGVPNLTEIYNRGIGIYTRGTRDAEKKGKALGLVPIGDAHPEQVILRKKPDDYRPILKEGLRKLKTMSAPDRRRLDRKLKAERYLARAKGI